MSKFRIIKHELYEDEKAINTIGKKVNTKENMFESGYIEWR